MTEQFKVPVPDDWISIVDESGALSASSIGVKPPKETGLTRRTMPKYDIFEEDEGWMVFYFLFDDEAEAIHFKLKYF